jgi:ferredoxin-thioredoxin reductase catalytic subunit
MKNKDINIKRLEILGWANQHDFIIDPYKGMDQHIESFFKCGWCPCDKTKSRKDCPCPESLTDVLSEGHCLCRLFWTRQAVIKQIKKDIKERLEAENERKRLHNILDNIIEKQSKGDKSQSNRSR